MRLRHVFLGAALFWLALASWAFSQSPMVPGFPPGTFQNRAALDATPSGGSFSLTEGTNVGSATTGTTTITYSGVTWGSGCNAVVFLIYWYNTGTADTITGLTVGGSAVGVSQETGVISHTPSGGGQSIDIWKLTSPGGTSGNVAVTFSANVTYNSNVTPYCLVSGTTTKTSSGNTTGAGCSNVVPISGSVTVPGGGAAVIMSSTLGGAAISWTNATGGSGSPYTGGGTQDAWAKATSTATVSATPPSGDECTLGWAAYGP